MNEGMKNTRISNSIHEILNKEDLTYFEVLGILEVVKGYYVTSICQLKRTTSIKVSRVEQ